MTSRRRAPAPIRCKRCHRVFPRHTEAGRHVRDGGYCVQCKAETTRDVRYYAGCAETDPVALDLEPEEAKRLAKVAAKGAKDRTRGPVEEKR